LYYDTDTKTIVSNCSTGEEVLLSLYSGNPIDIDMELTMSLIAEIPIEFSQSSFLTSMIKQIIDNTTAIIAPSMGVYLSNYDMVNLSTTPIWTSKLQLNATISGIYPITFRENLAFNVTEDLLPVSSLFIFRECTSTLYVC